MNLSMTELESLSKRAARGAGYDWGLAEEAGNAVRWLSERGLDGPGALLAALEAKDAGRLFAPEEGLSVWGNPAGDLCPLLVGAGLADFAPVTNMALQYVAAPLLILPFEARLAARGLGIRKLKIREFLGVTDGDQLWCDGVAPDLADVVIDVVTDAPTYAPRPRVSRCEMAEDMYAALGRFAHRTYAPATEESRLSGAGAGLSDND